MSAQELCQYPDLLHSTEIPKHLRRIHLRLHSQQSGSSRAHTVSGESTGEGVCSRLLAQWLLVVATAANFMSQLSFYGSISPREQHGQQHLESHTEAGGEAGAPHGQDGVCCPHKDCDAS